jgi:hypothetical protein
MFECDLDLCEVFAAGLIMAGIVMLLLWCFVISCEECRNTRARKRRRHAAVRPGRILTRLVSPSSISFL